VENGEVDAVSHGGGVSLFIDCKHGMDDDARLPISGALWIRHAPSVTVGPVRDVHGDGDGGARCTAG
jgi:hypothetical protein